MAAPGRGRSFGKRRNRLPKCEESKCKGTHGRGGRGAPGGPRGTRGGRPCPCLEFTARFPLRYPPEWKQ